MLKAIGAVVAGFVAWTVLFLGSNALISMALPESFNPDGSTDSVVILLVILVLSVVFSIAAGLLTARLGGDMAFKGSIGLGVLLLVVGVFVQVQFWDVMPLWYHLLFLGALIPGVLLGYRIAVARKAAASPAW